MMLSSNLKVGEAVCPGGVGGRVEIASGGGGGEAGKGKVGRGEKRRGGKLNGVQREKQCSQRQSRR